MQYVVAMWNVMTYYSTIRNEPKTYRSKVTYIPALNHKDAVRMRSGILREFQSLIGDGILSEYRVDEHTTAMRETEIMVEFPAKKGMVRLTLDQVEHIVDEWTKPAKDAFSESQDAEAAE